MWRVALPVWPAGGSCRRLQGLGGAGSLPGPGQHLVQLVAFGAVGLFVTYGMFGGFSDLFRQAAASPELAVVTS